MIAVLALLANGGLFAVVDAAAEYQIRMIGLPALLANDEVLMMPMFGLPALFANAGLLMMPSLMPLECQMLGLPALFANAGLLMMPGELRVKEKLYSPPSKYGEIDLRFWTGKFILSASEIFILLDRKVYPFGVGNFYPFGVGKFTHRGAASVKKKQKTRRLR